jgi:hypothetical protein
MKQAHASAVQFLRGVSRSGTLRATGTFFRRQLWAWPVLAAVLLGATGWWVYASVEGVLAKQVADRLDTIQDAGVTSLRIWMKQQQADAKVLSSGKALLPLARELLALESRAPNLQATLLRSKPLADVRSYFGHRLQFFGYPDFMVASRSCRVLASNHDALIGLRLDGYRREFLQKVLRGQPLVSRPFRSMLLLSDEKGQLRAGLPTMIVAAPIRNEKGRPVAVLGLRIRPEGSFTEILRVARSGETGETYAFDKTGLFLSQSRFDDDLKRIGLLADEGDTKSILTLQVRDPQVNLAAGERPALKRADQPLTRMAADAVVGRSGTDVRGYRDFRGVPVVGAWTWLPEYDFGVATEMEVAEAYRPLRVLRLVFWGLMGILAVCAAGLFVFMIAMRRQQLALRKAVLQAKQLGQYTLEEKIGSGGMGSVYRARHALLRRPTAVKLLDPDKVSPLAVSRFEREVQLTSRLANPNTVAIYDYGRTPEGVFFYAMEYLDGINLEDLVNRFGPLPAGRVVSILRQVCRSLAEAHEQGLVHRDIKPANILLCHRGGMADFVKVLDFGLARAVGAEGQARLTAADSLTGTPLYLAPESIERPDAVDARTDLYALGAVAYFLLTGTPVFRGATLAEICMHHVKTPPEPPSQRLGHPVHPVLEALILACLAKAPGDRPPTAQAIEARLGECADLGDWKPADAEAWWQRFKSEPGTAQPTGSTDSVAVTAEFRQVYPSEVT